MRKLFFFLSLFSFAMVAKAQFGYYSNSEVMKVLPSYELASADYERLCCRCEKEIEHNERELTRKYVAFLDGYRDFPEPILRKRQNELQGLVDNSIKFRKELKMWLAQAKDSLFAPTRELVSAAVEKVCHSCNLDYVIDVDLVKYAYANPNKSVDITTMLLDAVLNPDKPVTELNGYEECLKFFAPVVQPVYAPSRADVPVEETNEEAILIPITEETAADADAKTGVEAGVEATEGVE